jgi:hypothetical protein
MEKTLKATPTKMDGTKESEVIAGDKKIIEQLFAERDSYQAASQTQRADINDIYQSYVGEIDDVKDRSKSQEKITKLRTETNYIVPSIFSGNPEIEVEAVGEEDKDLAQVGEEIINYRMDTIPQAYEKIESWVKQSVVFGTSLLNVCWRIETEEGKGVTEDEPDFQVPNILDCYYNPIIADVEGQQSIIFRSVLSLKEIKEDYPKVADKIKAKQGTQSDQYNSSRQVQNDKINLQKASKDTIEIYERINCDRIQTVADGMERVLLRDVENPYDMYTLVKLIHEPNAIPNRFDGFGAGHNTLGLGKLIQKFANRLTDNANLANTPAFMFKKGAGIDKKQLVIKAGGGIEVDGDGAIRDQIAQVDIHDITQGGLALLNRFDDEHKRATGANDLIQGSASNKTLGQDQIASTYSSNRFELINRRFKQALADVGRILLMMEIENIQSMDAPILKIFPLEAEVVGGKIRYSRETVYQMLISARERDDLNFNIKIKGDTNVVRNKDMLLKQFAEWYNLFGPILPPPNQLAAAKKWLELRGIDDVDKLVPDPEQMAQEQAMQAQQQPGMPTMGGQPQMPVNPMQAPTA